MNEITVRITTSGFQPNPATVDAPAMIVWANTTSVVQDATSDDGGQTFTTGPIQPGASSLPITFSKGTPAGMKVGYTSTATGLKGDVIVRVPIQEKDKATAAVSFAKQILPLFTTIDIEHMKPMGVLLGSYSYMSDPTGSHQNATTVQAYLAGTKQPRMPLGGPYWSPAQLSLYAQWMSGGFQP